MGQRRVVAQRRRALLRSVPERHAGDCGRPCRYGSLGKRRGPIRSAQDPGKPYCDTPKSHHHGESGALSRPVCATEPTSEANAGAATTATWDRRLPRPGRTVLNSGGLNFRAHSCGCRYEGSGTSSSPTKSETTNNRTDAGFSPETNPSNEL